MLTRRFVLTACLGLVPAGSVLAQGLVATPDGPPPPPLGVSPPIAVPPPAIVPQPPRPPAPAYDEDDQDYGISRREAVRIARRRGLVDVDDVRRRRGVWIVSGTDDDGDDVRIVINDEGDVVDVRRD